MKTRVILLGSTGSIGTQAMEIIEANPDRFEVVGLSCGGRSVGAVIEQARRLGLKAEQVAVSHADAARTASAELGGTVLSGPDSSAELVRSQSAETVLNGLVGSLGLGATLAALESGARLALANKESLVAGGDIVLRAAAEGQLVPVDSEHSAMAQCLRSGKASEVARFVLTASGGPFRGWSRQRMWDVTPEQAAAHPTWSMGQMNTLNSATLINKGLELIEASYLFGIDPQAIDVSVHPQSIIHSMVTFVDGCTIAQASPPSMKLPISHALAWPERVADAQPALDFTQSFSWEFEPVDNEAFPAVELARHAAACRGSVPAVYNAANEEAAEAFVQGRIRFPEIVDVVAEIVDKAQDFASPPQELADVLAVEDTARALAQEAITRRAR
ncbi:1-deoxy-D-xylulose 5-phosphate reductoisomerase [Corynebacterium ciconiae DSM 44920]|uniref:1-deoxy-D-xylulose-5-phosphate reductoisomerase n=1 Tax=Corynebacterium ciconiae TaxID=227319 RepID=UPI0003750691|nr:1-deoxy-D-xylulose-5-phosphate reductoisomerase [Corynebacterium ciconiae]WKD61465.1 1-deoxy-D-xylulose 5-phosphate reductoisomerase [Corynebacterium ciconiae DSM 44920]